MNRPALRMDSSFAPNHRGMPILAEDNDLDFSAQHRVSYCETSLFRSWREVLRRLDTAGTSTGQAPT